MRLVTERLVLREFEESDAEDTNAYERDPEVVRYQSHGVRSHDESLAYIRRVRIESGLSAPLEGPRRIYDLAVTLGGRLVGRAGLGVTLFEGALAEGEAGLWYVVHPDAWGQGVAPEACGALLRFAFEELRLHRVFVDADARNGASIRVAEKLGMRHEGRFVQNAWFKGEWTDSVILAMLRSEHVRA